jgi:hypothetical protein
MFPVDNMNQAGASTGVPHDLRFGGHRDDEPLRRQWMCCKCDSGPFFLGSSFYPRNCPSEDDGSEFYDICPCTHSICGACDLKIIQGSDDGEFAPSNLLKSLSAEFEALQQHELLPHIWFCCNCDSGPNHVEQEANLDDHTVPDYILDKCDKCDHSRCISCPASKLPRSTPINKPVLKRLSSNRSSKTLIPDNILVCGPKGKILDRYTFN